MTAQPALWLIAGGATACAIAAGLADRRRNRRADLDRVGWMPWPLLQLIAMLAAMVAAGFALKF